jgi:hypothetical protein
MAMQYKITRGLQSPIIWPFRWPWRVQSKPPIHIEKWPHKDSQEIYKRLIDRFVFHKDNAEGSVRWAHHLAWVLALFIPILSAAITFLASSPGFQPPGWLVPSVGLLLTIVTIFNSASKQDQRYASLSEKLIELNDWKFELDIATSKLNSNNKKECYSLLMEKSDKLSQIGKEILLVAIPKQPEFDQ